MTAANKDKTAKIPGKPFKAGTSGNPKGRPKQTPEEIDLIAACKTKTSAALAVIEEIMAHSDNDRNRLTAAITIIERAWGKPTQSTEITGADGGAIKHSIKVTFG